jgi:hypothetical protein
MMQKSSPNIFFNYERTAILERTDCRGLRQQAPAVCHSDQANQTGAEEEQG